MLRWVLLVMVAVRVSTFTVHQMAYQRDCIDLECDRHTSEHSITKLLDTNGTVEQCRGCQHCTITGYSVCIRLRENALRAKRELDESSLVCGCAHSIPATCEQRPTLHKSSNDSNRLFNICYLSALQKPPHPQAENKQTSVLVTIDPFWMNPYWKGLHLSNLTVHYQFPVTISENCDGTVIPATTDGLTDHCKANLQIEMSETEAIAVENDVEDKDTDEEYYDDDGVSEVQFDRAVFAGADHVMFWYTVQVNRPRQLNVRQTDSPISDETTTLDSISLGFDLETTTYGFGDSANEEMIEDDSAEVNVDEKDEADLDKDEAGEGDEGGRDEKAQQDVEKLQSEQAGDYEEEGPSDGEEGDDENTLIEKTAEEVAREVDFFAEDEARPIPLDDDGAPITDATFMDQRNDKEKDIEKEDSNEDGDDPTEGAFSEAPNEQTTLSEVSDADTITLSDNDQETKTEDGVEQQQSDITEEEQDVDLELEPIDDSGIEGEKDEDEDVLDGEEGNFDKEEDMSTEEDNNEEEEQEEELEDVEQIEEDPEVERHSELDPSEGDSMEEEVGEEKEQGDDVELHDDKVMSNMEQLNDINVDNQEDRTDIDMSPTPRHTDATTTLPSTGTEAFLHSILDKFGLPHLSLTAYVVGVIIVVCLMVLCVVVCVGMRSTLCGCVDGERNKSMHSNGVNSKYKYTPAHAQPLHPLVEKDSLHH